MRVRVYDKDNNAYFKSEVYAKINTGWYERQLVIVPSDNGAYIKFFDYLDKSDTNNPVVLINTITPDKPDDWIYQRMDSTNQHLVDYKGLINNNMIFFEYIGYPWVFENKSLMINLLKGDSISLKGSIFENKILDYKLQDWNYIEASEDASYLLEQAFSFHDSILKDLKYISGAYVNNDQSMHPLDDVRQVTMLFESQCCNPIEMVFEGVTELNLRPAKDNCIADIFSASLFVQNASVFFCDCHLEKIDKSYEGTWISAYSLRWRFVK